MLDLCAPTLKYDSFPNLTSHNDHTNIEIDCLILLNNLKIPVAILGPLSKTGILFFT